MKNLIILFIILSIISFEAMAQQSNSKKATKSTKGTKKSGAPSSSKAFNYPTAPRTDTKDDYFGSSVADPYRWLEDIDSKDSKTWISEQNNLTIPFLNNLPKKKMFENRLKELWNYERYSVPFKKGGKYFYFHNNGLQNHDVLFTQNNLHEKPRILIDPNTLSDDGTTAISGIFISKDGKFMVYSLSKSGSDWQEFHIKGVETGKDLPEVLHGIKFSGASWTADGRGFYYSRYPMSDTDLKERMANQKIYYHQLGSPQEVDKIVYQRSDKPDWGFGAHATEDGNYLLISVWEGTGKKNCIYYKDLTKHEDRVHFLFDNFTAEFEYLANDGSLFFFQTNSGASKGKIIAVDLNSHEKNHWMNVVNEENDVLEATSVVANNFICQYLKDAHSLVRVYSMQGKKLREIELPTLGTVGGFSGERNDSETFYSFTSFTYPTTIFHFNANTGQSEIFKKPEVKFNPNDYTVEQVFVTSKDRTRIPMYLVYKKGLKRDGQTPTYLYGYGGFGVSYLPEFEVKNLVWLEAGGIYAMANLRGGGEYGEAWHLSGTKENKQNVFNDFISAAEYLIEQKYTSKEKLAVSGRSNGGLLVGAVMTQRPDLFAVALPTVGVLDMLRYQKFTIGWAWASDYGSSQDPESFKYLYAYSPLHNLHEGTKYPATLISTGDHDDRVYPAHSFKFAAALQAAQAGSNPTLIRISVNTGHGAGKPFSILIEEEAQKWAFVAEYLKMK